MNTKDKVFIFTNDEVITMSFSTLSELKMIEKIFREQRKLYDNPVPSLN